MTSLPQKDSQLVTPDGQPVAPLIDGVVQRPAVTISDDRGTLTEIFRPEWNVHPAPLVMLYQFTIRPGKVKGWHLHRLHDDRMFLSQGSLRVVLYDDRSASPTYHRLNIIYRSDYHRDLLTIPAGVYHALQNIGTSDALLISMPTRVYDHADPDVYRLPLYNDYIPYHFDDLKGY
jgi:dTDP-4-dehydrorhamnose 3,5-epimerase